MPTDGYYDKKLLSLIKQKSILLSMNPALYALVCINEEIKSKLDRIQELVKKRSEVMSKANCRDPDQSLINVTILWCCCFPVILPCFLTTFFLVSLHSQRINTEIESLMYSVEEDKVLGELINSLKALKASPAYSLKREASLFNKCDMQQNRAQLVVNTIESFLKSQEIYANLKQLLTASSYPSRQYINKPYRNMRLAHQYIQQVSSFVLYKHILVNLRACNCQ